MRSAQFTFTLDTGEGFAIHDLSAAIDEKIEASGISNGFIILSSMHTTTAICINEFEERLLDDLKAYFSALVPADRPYKHNDLHLRENIPDDEPENAHAHIMALLIGSSEVVPLIHGKPGLGQYQSVMLMELDGPRRRSVGIRIIGE